MKGAMVTYEEHNAVCIFPPVLDELRIKLEHFFIVHGEQGVRSICENGLCL